MVVRWFTANYNAAMVVLVVKVALVDEFYFFVRFNFFFKSFFRFYCSIQKKLQDYIHEHEHTIKYHTRKVHTQKQHIFSSATFSPAGIMLWLENLCFSHFMTHAVRDVVTL